MEEQMQQLHVIPLTCCPVSVLFLMSLLFSVFEQSLFGPNPVGQISYRLAVTDAFSSIPDLRKLHITHCLAFSLG